MKKKMPVKFQSQEKFLSGLTAVTLLYIKQHLSKSLIDKCSYIHFEKTFSMCNELLPCSIVLYAHAFIIRCDPVNDGRLIHLIFLE